MKLKVDDSLLAGAKLVFLDTSDWSELEKGCAGGDDLRALCEAGHARIIVTADHLLEVAGLTSGLESRLEFMRRFPGALLIACGGSQMLKLAAYVFAYAVFGHGMPPQPLICTTMQSESATSLNEIVDRARTVRRVQDYYARTMSSVRAREKTTPRDVRQMTEKLHRLARKGDVEAVLDYAQRRRPLTGVTGLVQQLSARALVRLYEWGNEHGILSSASRGDFLFDELVSAALPRSVSRNSKLMAEVYKVWTQPQKLLAVSPSLACVAEIARQSTQAKDVQKIRSTIVDKWHAAFAPLVDVFSCDGRIHPIVARTLRGHSPTIVLPSSKLALVVEALNSR